MLGKGHGGQYKASKKKEESERQRRERDQIKLIDLRFERWQVVRFRKARRRQEEGKKKARRRQEEGKKKARRRQEEGKKKARRSISCMFLG